MGFHLAQLNIARWAIGEDDPLREEFEASLGAVNAAAEAAPGFMWRLADDSGSALSFRFLNDPDLIVNMSVWESWEALKAFTYKGDHLPVFRRRSDWFVRSDETMLVMWWVPVGHIPDLDEGGDRLMRLRGIGPTEYGFDTANRFPAPYSS